jgi:hypothetical protein|tara:strand:- start:3930 stop:4196 length:267 start_codon:yes stop_codon:yes gene_type:complete
MTDSDDPRLRSPQFLGTVTDLDEFKKEKARKKANAGEDPRPDAEVIPFPGRLDHVTESSPADREEDVRGRMTEEEKAKDPPMHEHDCD